MPSSRPDRQYSDPAYSTSEFESSDEDSSDRLGPDSSRRSSTNSTRSKKGRGREYSMRALGRDPERGIPLDDMNPGSSARRRLANTVNRVELPSRGSVSRIKYTQGRYEAIMCSGTCLVGGGVIAITLAFVPSDAPVNIVRIGWGSGVTVLGFVLLILGHWYQKKAFNG